MVYDLPPRPSHGPSKRRRRANLDAIKDDEQRDNDPEPVVARIRSRDSNIESGHIEGPEQKTDGDKLLLILLREQRHHPSQEIACAEEDEISNRYQMRWNEICNGLNHRSSARLANRNE